tara:strand:- start:429 stop:1172 length:744 start_codon:yes stop_codon:yes gene_type:complete
MSLSDINIRERKFHNDLHASGQERSQNKFYKALYHLYSDFINILQVKTKSAEVLDYGCGIGNFAEQISAFKPKKIIAIDISEEAIKKAKNRKQIYNNKIDYRVDNCEKLSLDKNSFDLVYGSGILHHLNLDKSLNEINRVLKKNGTLIFVEPLATNPFINIYRKFTPKARSEDEHPFKYDDINLIKKMFKNVEIKYYGFLTLILFPLYKSPAESKLFGVISKIDKFLLSQKYLKFLAWSVIISAEKS